MDDLFAPAMLVERGGAGLPVWTVVLPVPFLAVVVADVVRVAFFELLVIHLDKGHSPKLKCLFQR